MTPRVSKLKPKTKSNAHGKPMSPNPPARKKFKGTRTWSRNKSINEVMYPKSIDENRRYRVHLLQRAENEPILQEALREKCKRDMLFWIDLFAWTKDPRRNPSILPFVTYDFQVPTLRKIERSINLQEDLLIDKSRDMGVSWSVLYVFLHKWLFEPGSDFRIGSRKEEYVDKAGDIDTLFEKLRFCLEKQPLWLMPYKFEWNKHSSYMKLINPELGNSVIGESANANFGTGGRRKAILLDEFSKWDQAEAVWTSTGDATPCRIPVSTPLGSGNKFARLAVGTKETIKKLSLHWTLHPSKRKGAYYLDGDDKIPISPDSRAYEIWKSKRGKLAPLPMKGGVVRSPWYDAECARRTAGDIAQELDIDYLQSGSPFFDLVALEKQRVWIEIERKFPTDKIPYGNFIRCKLVKRLNKIEVRDMPRVGWLKIFEEPKPGYQYVIGDDVAEGLPKGDEGTIVVREKITRDVVATANGLYKPEELAEMSFLVERYYSDALNMPENNNHGYTVAKLLEDWGSNLYYTVRDETGEGEVVTTKRGWSTTVKTRPQMLDEMEEEVRNLSCELRDEVLIAQARTFVTNERGKPQADGDFLDDMILAFAICGRGITQNPFKGSRTKVHSKQARRVYEIKKKTKNGGFSYKRKRR